MCCLLGGPEAGAGQGCWVGSGPLCSQEFGARIYMHQPSTSTCHPSYLSMHLTPFDEEAERRPVPQKQDGKPPVPDTPPIQGPLGQGNQPAFRRADWSLPARWRREPTQMASCLISSLSQDAQRVLLDSPRRVSL